MRVLVAIDADGDAIATVAAFAVGFPSAGVPVLRAHVPSVAACPTAATVGQHLIVKNWQLTRSKKSLPHV